MRNILVLQSDFGVVDGAVSAMIGVALSVDDTIKIYDLSHSITPFNIFEASYRLFQSLQYWPEGTVFVSVVDPGVGSNRTSVVAKTKTGHIVVTPNNGTLSHLKQFVGIELAYVIDVEKNRRQGAFNQSYTFDGRDLYAYIGARLASNKLQLTEVGSLIEDNQILELELPTSSFDRQCVKGSIEIFDERYGSLWTSILVDDFYKLSPKYGQIFDVSIWHNELRIFADKIVYGKAFNDVPIHSLVLYVNSLNRMAIAINQGSVSDEYSISSGLEWKVEIKPVFISKLE